MARQGRGVSCVSAAPVRRCAPAAKQARAGCVSQGCEPPRWLRARARAQRVCCVDSVAGGAGPARNWAGSPGPGSKPLQSGLLRRAAAPSPLPAAAPLHRGGVDRIGPRPQKSAAVPVRSCAPCPIVVLPRSLQSASLAPLQRRAASRRRAADSAAPQGAAQGRRGRQSKAAPGRHHAASGGASCARPLSGRRRHPSRRAAC